MTKTLLAGRASANVSLTSILVRRRSLTTASPENEDDIRFGAEILEQRKGQMFEYA